MKANVLLVFLAISTTIVHAQNNTRVLISSGGDEFKGENISLEWSLGEVMIAPFNGENVKLTQGFQQPVYTITSVKGKRKYNDLVIYPNPCTTHFFIKKDDNNDQLLIIQVYDLNGKTILEKQLNIGENKIDVHSLENNMYIIRIFNKKNKAIKSFKLEKI